MNLNVFLELDLTDGDLIHFFIKGGEKPMGYYDGGYDVSNGTFLFRNHATGKSETIYISEIEELSRVRVS